MGLLRKFSDAELILDRNQAWSVLQFFNFTVPRLPPAQLTNDDRRFAQALLVLAIDKSYSMGYAQAMFQSFAGSSPGLLSIPQFAIRAAANRWTKCTNPSDLENIQIYEIVRLNIIQNFKTAWEYRLAGIGGTLQKSRAPYPDGIWDR